MGFEVVFVVGVAEGEEDVNMSTIEAAIKSIKTSNNISWLFLTKKKTIIPLALGDLR